MPTIGKIPIVMPTLTIRQKPTIDRIPVAKSSPSGSLALKAISEARKIKVAKSTKSTRTPMKPHCSANTAKTKSVWPSGRNLSRLCVASSRPLPSRPPDQDHRDEDEGEAHRGAQVRLLQDQEEPREGDQARHDHPLDPAEALHVGEVLREHEDQHQLGHFRRLEDDGPHGEPALGTAADAACDQDER